MIKKTEVIKFKREASPKYLNFCNEEGDLKCFQTNFDTDFNKYLSQSDTCQSDGA